MPEQNRFEMLAGPIIEDEDGKDWKYVGVTNGWIDAEDNKAGPRQAEWLLSERDRLKRETELDALRRVVTILDGQWQTVQSEILAYLNARYPRQK